MKLLAITSCPVGIAHTYIAAEKLNKMAKKMGVEIKVETQGSTGAENVITEQDIKEADGIIIAADKAVSLERFEGMAMIECPISRAIKEPDVLIQMFLDGKVEKKKTSKIKSVNEAKKEMKSKQPAFYKHLMGGVSYMIPVVVVAGLLIAIALAFGGQPTEAGLVIPDGSFWKKIEQIGGAGFTFMVPVLSGFIAYSIADRPGLVPGLIGGYIASNGYFYGSQANAGFLGGIVTGFLAGYVAKGLKSIKVPDIIRPIMPIIIIPIISTLVTGLAFIFILGGPITSVFEGLTNFLAGLSGTSSVVLATILGAMVAFDMGGPVNKVAFLFGVSMITAGHPEVMGPIAASVAIPPIGMGIATFLRKKFYSKEELDAGKAAFAMGLCGITEGAIPFASVDPLRVIPSLMVGSIVGANIAMLGKVTDIVPHGGPIVALMGGIEGVLMFLVAIIAGSMVSALMVNYLKGMKFRKEAK
ncbi:PTS fructose transporter subunit IIC [Clostridium septicum]|uniref:Fructose-specific PTS transporter subunit EIIC n=1 Tax=Clostridium septicum TaxID=1504 RepID=A0ABY5B287_CLOSE|nr:fructose-specific PTS transporter subunit EIIC [Clostridium septicum]MDU1314549.1 fructose-specific PTS transporter subunit EIIC [Clostridium septicum]UEC21359.1 fructose-specific PTS transporter subunit EIIC [Clostridium septicum]USS00596.1 fructose-specific PTS transporter subunit EIIC [Clostridium septicum]WLF69142.1 fructose-specific PTS transporter subunit EIIC [Clostridium septicum]